MIGQVNLRSRLGGMARLKRVPRFIVFVGEIGSGRRTLAKWLAETMSIQFVEVEKSVDEVRNVASQCYKITEPTLYFISDGDTMSVAAKNALLKVTEEPPRYAYFVISTTEAERLLPTLTSRASVFHMDSYAISELGEFANDPENIGLYANCCTNGREVALVKSWGVDVFSDFVNLVVDNIAEVSGSNALKMEERIAFNDTDDGFDIKVFLQAFRAECMRRIVGLEDKSLRNKYIAWIQITSDRLQEVQIRAINKQSVFDMWVFDIREVVRSAEG